MNKYAVKLLALLSISIFIVSTIGPSLALTLFVENNDELTIGNETSIITSNSRLTDDDITDTNLSKNMGSGESIYHQQPTQTNNFPSITQPNILTSTQPISSPQRHNVMVNSPLLDVPSDNVSADFSEMESSTTSNHPATSTGSSVLAKIVSWNEVAQKNIMGWEKIDYKYPANLLVNITSTNNIEFVLKLRNVNDINGLSGLFSTYNVNIEQSLPSLSSVVVLVPLVNLNAFLQSVSSNTNIMYAEPNGYIHVQYVPNDPYWTTQWGPQIIGMPTAWNNELGNRSIKVAVIDTGIDYTHPDLINNYLPIGYNWLANTSDPMDDNGHGTHVAGTIAAAINNGIGVAGIANISIFAEKFLDSSGYGSNSNAALAINHAVAMGANILSNSWGSFFNSSLVADAFAEAINTGVIVVAAAGNSNTDLPSFPADLPGVIGVAATDNMDQKASFSNYGEYVDVAAPGVNILSDYLGNSYVYMSGTSMATPHVSGLVALLMSKYPTYTAMQIENLLYSTAVDLGTPGWDPMYGWGRINAMSASFGPQTHNILVYINASSPIPVNLNSTFYAVVRNIGLSTETNIVYKIFLNTTIILNGTIPSLSPGELQSIPISLLPTGSSSYTIDLVIEPVPGEVVTTDNSATRFVQAVYKQIDVNVGDILSYTYYFNNTRTYGPVEPYEYAWKVTGEISPTAYNVSYVLFDASSQTDFIYYTAILNPYTRTIINAPWGLFPYWINTTGLTLGSTLDLYHSGGQEGTVIGYASYNYYGISIPVLVVDDSYELDLFDMNTGVLLSVCSPDITTPVLATAYTSVHPQGFDLHNVRGIITDITSSTNTETTINFAVQNTGIYDESSDVTLLVNNTILITEIFSLVPGQCQFFNVSWVPSSTTYLSMELLITPVINETYLVDNDLNATLFIEALSHFLIRVYNAETNTPISAAQVNVYEYYTKELVDTGFTDINGNYSTIGLQIGYYKLLVSAAGFANQYSYNYITTNGVIILLTFNMSPPLPKSVQILSPTNETVVYGSRVDITYITSDMNSITFINIYVNDVYIATTYPTRSIYIPPPYPTNAFTSDTGEKLIVPVFSNDTNTILLNFVWDDGLSANATVNIESVNVVPTFYPKTGDYLIYRTNLTYISPSLTSFILANYTFSNWITSTKINLTYTIALHQPSNGVDVITVINKSWLLVDTLNGFVDDPTSIARGVNFYLLTNLGFTNVNGHGSIGDTIPYNTWSNVLTVKDSNTWKGINVWVLNDDIDGSKLYFNRLNGILVYQQYSFGEELYLVNTSFPLIAPAPVVTGSPDLTYQLGTTNHAIIWNITGPYPDTYSIMVNGSVITTGKWYTGASISHNIDGLGHKVYIYTLVASNVGGWNTSNTVVVRVVDSPQLNSPPDITYYIGAAGIKIIWNATDDDPNTYSIARNGTIINSGNWQSGVGIIFGVDNLPIGIFNFVINVTDLEGLSASDTVVVIVKAASSSPSTTPGFGIFILISALISLTVLGIHYKKKQR